MTDEIDKNSVPRTKFFPLCICHRAKLSVEDNQDLLCFVLMLHKQIRIFALYGKCRFSDSIYVNMNACEPFAELSVNANANGFFAKTKYRTSVSKHKMPGQNTSEYRNCAGRVINIFCELWITGCL